METGYLVDMMYGHGTASAPKWVAGEPERSICTGLKLRGKPRLAVKSYRCRQCGILESYASE